MALINFKENINSITLAVLYLPMSRTSDMRTSGFKRIDPPCAYDVCTDRQMTSNVLLLLSKYWGL